MAEDERAGVGLTRAELRRRRARARRTDGHSDADAQAETELRLDAAADDDPDRTRIVARQPAVAAVDTGSPVDDVSPVDDDQTRLFFRPQPEPEDLDRTALAARHRSDDDVTLRSPRVAPEPDDTWHRGAEPRRDTFTGEPTQSASASIPGVIEAPRRRVALADGEQEPPTRVASVPAVIDVLDVYPPRPPEDPLAAHLALEQSTRGPATVIDGASVLIGQRRRARRRLAALITAIVVVWGASAAGLAALLLL